MSDIEARLEARLLELGSQERGLEQLVAELRSEARTSVKMGDLDRAEMLCATLDEVRVELAPLQSEIMRVERKLYGMRLRRRQ